MAAHGPPKRLGRLNDLADVNVSGAASGQFLKFVGGAWVPSSVTASLSVDWSDVSGKPTSFPVDWADVSGKPTAFPTTWADVSGKPVEFNPSPHTHPIGEITALQAALDALATAQGSVSVATLMKFGAI